MRLNLKKWFSQKIIENKAKKIPLDVTYYRMTYPDLVQLTNQELAHHWIRHGFKEGRYASARHADGDTSATPIPVKDLSKETVDVDFYLQAYPNLKEKGIVGIAASNQHFREFGLAESLLPNFKCWCDANGVESNIFPEPFNLSDVLNIKENYHFHLDGPSILSIILGHLDIPIFFVESKKENGFIYTSLSKRAFYNAHKDKAKKFLMLALHFSEHNKAYEYLGNSYLDDKHYAAALTYYKKALKKSRGCGKWVYINAANCFINLYQVDKAINLLLEGIRLYPNWSMFYSKLNEACEKLWQDYAGEVNGLVDANDREGLISKTEDYINIVYNAYFNAFNGEHAPARKHINSKQILLIGDFHVQQCIRYRIKQKQQQLALAGVELNTLDWTKLAECENQLALYDIVIFYRVPAMPKLLKAIAQVNATGGISIYEIDDLLFDASYPPPIDSYGGTVNNATYRELLKGMPLFRAAMQECQYGIASTLPLLEIMSSQVKTGKVILHRNGLDESNKASANASSSTKNTIDIIYGSGTQAHNSDFIEIVLPVLSKVLKEYPNVRFDVIGHLKLPNTFIKTFSEQVTQYPITKTLDEYWEHIKSADINIAVLHPDKINNCKSELKWFEAGFFAVPSIVSNTQNYIDIINHKEDGLVAGTDAEWYSAFKLLIENESLRKTIGSNAQKRILKDYSLNALGTNLASELLKLTSINQKSNKPKKKIALVNVFFPPQTIGGATRVVADNFDELITNYNEEYEIVVFTADAECRDPQQLTSYSYQGAKVYRATTLWREHMEWHPQDAKMGELFNSFLDSEMPDLVHFHCVQRLTASIVGATKEKNIPYIITVHDAWWISDYQFLVDENDNVYPNGHPDDRVKIPVPKGIKRRQSEKRKNYLKNLLNSAKHVLTVSESFADIYKKNGVPNIKVTKNGISNKVAWQPKDTSYTDKVVCGHVGGMSAHKGYDILKKAVIEQQPKALEFLIVDHSKEPDYVSKQSWGIVPVTFIGRQNQEDVVELYRKIDVLFAPSIWPESFGLVTREAAACGCWIVATNLGGIGEDVVEGKTGYVIEPAGGALVNVLTKLNRSAKTHKQLAERTNVRDVSEQAVEVTNIYMNILKAIND